MLTLITEVFGVKGSFGDLVIEPKLVKEQFDDDGNSKWKAIEEEWLRLFRNHKSVAGLSAKAEVTGKDEWLCEAYMKTEYTKLREEDFQRTLNSYLAYLIKEGKIYES